MNIHNVYLFLRKLNNEELQFCILILNTLFFCSIKYNLDILLNLIINRLTSFFADLYYESYLCKHWNVLH